MGAGRRLAGRVAAAALLGSCGAQPDIAPTATIPETTPAPRISSDERGAAVAVSGTLSADGTLCPAEQGECDYGVVIEGGAGDVAPGDFVVGQGWYDGRRVVLAAPLVRRESPSAQPSYQSLCPEMSNPASVDTNTALDTARSIVGGEDPTNDVLAAAWIDRATNVLTLWFARDLDSYRDVLLNAYGDMKVCLVDGARLSLQELFDVSERLDEMLRQRGVAVQGGPMIDELRNRVVVPIEAMDAAARIELEQFDSVVAVPFIELIDRPLSELPQWQYAVPGTVDLITMASRMSGEMDALGTFTMWYDASANCLYAEVDGQRSTFVWPFGYSGTSSDGVVTVFDARGEPAARTGEEIQLGGGGGDAIMVLVTGDDRCSATSFWFVNG